MKKKSNAKKSPMKKGQKTKKPAIIIAIGVGKPRKSKKK